MRVHADTELRVAGYTDDTAVYLGDSSATDACFRDLKAFGQASRLRGNLEKSALVRLSTQELTPTARDGPIPVLDGTAMCRYLGVQVGPGTNEPDNWDGMIGALQHRLWLAQTKNHSTVQRAEIARSIVVPKIAFVARHSWPTSATVRRLQASMSSFVWGTFDGRSKRAWLSATHAELALREGGAWRPEHPGRADSNGSGRSRQVGTLELVIRTPRRRCLHRQHGPDVPLSKPIHQDIAESGLHVAGWV